MDAGAIIAIVIGVLIVLALVMWLSKRGRDRRHETRREEAISTGRFVHVTHVTRKNRTFGLKH